METLQTVKDVLNDAENKAQTSLNVLNDLAKVEKALQEKKVICILGFRNLESFLIYHITYLEIFFQLFRKIFVTISQNWSKIPYSLKVSYYRVAPKLKENYIKHFKTIKPHFLLL